jgi:dTDP-3-amino-3,4,6-trideoxy-alpha-D-glucose transaminase
MIQSPAILANDFQRQWADIGSDVLRAVERVGQSGWYVLGDEVKHFERALASYWGVHHATGVANGMDAIEIGLRLLGCGPGDRVLTTPLSAFATTLAILRIGAVPFFVDTDERGLIDLIRCRKVLEQRRDIRFFVPVHLYGHALDANKLEELRNEFGLRIVEDCAQSAGTATGAVGQVAATSFYPTKNLGAMGDGGAVLTNDAELNDRARVLRSYGETSRYRHEEIGHNSRLDEVQAALLREACLPRLTRWAERRREIAAAYMAGLYSTEITVPGRPTSSDSSWHLFPIHVAPDLRDAFITHLKLKGIVAGIHYPTAIPDQPAMSNARFEFADQCATARRICASEVSLPIHPYLTDDEVSYVIDSVNSFARAQLWAA